MEIPKSNVPRTEVAQIGKSVVIRGELTGSEDLLLDGEIEGTIELHQNALTVGPNGRVRAHINAKEVIIHGKVDGNVTGTERVELRRSGVLVGDIKTQRIVIEDGAYFKGVVDVERGSKQSTASESAAAAGAAGSAVQK